MMMMREKDKRSRQTREIGNYLSKFEVEPGYSARLDPIGWICVAGTPPIVHKIMLDIDLSCLPAHLPKFPFWLRWNQGSGRGVCRRLWQTIAFLLWQGRAHNRR